MDVSKLEVGKFYKNVSNNDVKYTFLLDKPIPIKDAYTVKAFIVMIHKSIDNVYIYYLDKEDHKFHLRDTDSIYDTNSNDYQYIIKRLFETKNLEWSN